jgi:GAF domain-containing protein
VIVYLLALPRTPFPPMRTYRMDEHGDLTASLLELASIAAGSVPLERVLSRIAGHAVDLLGSADGAVLTLLEDGPGVTVTTDPLFASADEARRGAGQGPSLTAVAGRRVVVSGSLGSDLAWPRFGSRVARLGLHSALAVPLIVHETLVGVVTVYARAEDAFGDEDVLILQDYARLVAAVARNAHVLARSQDQIEQLNEALRLRPVIDQAIGIIRYRTGKSEREAFLRLCEISNAQHLKVSDTAEDLVEEAVRAANVRRRHAY